MEELYGLDKERLTEEKVNVIGALVYCYTVAGAYEKAIAYNKELLDINAKEYGDFHPNTLNTMLSELKILGKMRMTASVIESRSKLRAAIADTLTHLITE